MQKPGREAHVLQRRFEQEARATAGLRSPHTVTLHDFGMSEDGSFYYAMELLEGLDVEDLVERFGPQPPARVVHILRDVCDSLAEAHGPVSILHFDAHPDLYDDFEGDPLSHASPFARIMENGLASSLVQVGIRTSNRHCREQAQRFAVETVEMNEFTPDRVPIPGAPLYISIDLDALDPAFAPGVSHHEPGGLSVRDILSVLHRVPGPIVGADVVEYNPTRDINGMTAVVAAKLVKELAALAA